MCTNYPFKFCFFWPRFPALLSLRRCRVSAIFQSFPALFSPSPLYKVLPSGPPFLTLISSCHARRLPSLRECFPRAPFFPLYFITQAALPAVVISGEEFALSNPDSLLSCELLRSVLALGYFKPPPLSVSRPRRAARGRSTLK